MGVKLDKIKQNLAEQLNEPVITQRSLPWLSSGAGGKIA
jgi:hypothetical protein